MSDTKKFELSRILNRNESINSIIKVQGAERFQAEQCLKNKIEYTFKIDSFDDNIEFSKSALGH